MMVCSFKIPKFTLSLALFLFSGAMQGLFAQGFNLVDRMFLESDNGEIYMNTRSVYADSGLYISGSVSLVQKAWNDTLTHQALISGYNDSGAKLFQKHIEIEDYKRTYTFGYSAICKTGTDRYAIACGGVDLDIKPQQGGMVEPFVYFFNGHGDSINYFTLKDSAINREITGVFTNNLQEILMIGEEALPTGTTISGDWGPDFVTDSTYFWLCKLDPNGQLLWHKKYPYMRSLQWGAFPTKLLVNQDQSEYMIAGTLDYGYPYLLKTDSAGNEIWHKPLQLREAYDAHPNVQYLLPECSVDIASAPGGGYYFISSTPYTATIDTLTDDQLAFYYGKLNEQGDTLWTKQYQPYTPYGTNLGRQIQVAANGDLIMAGNVHKNVPPFGYKEDRTCVFRTDSLGNIKWYREPMNYTTAQNNMTTYHDLWSLSLTPDHDGILAGGIYIGYYDPSLSTQPNTGNTFSWLILMDSLGQRCDEDTVLIDVPSPCLPIVFEGPLAIKPVTKAANSILLYPNPAYDKVNISIEGDEKLFSGAQIIICDVQGRTILSTKLKLSEPAIDVSALMKGIYIVTLRTADGNVVAKRKLVKQ